MKIIGINGFKRSGKGEVGDAIADITAEHFMHTIQVGFADKLKVLAARSLGIMLSDDECIARMNECKEEWLISASKVMDPKATEFWGTNYTQVLGLTGRQYLQNIGNEARKIFGEDFWIDQILPSNLGPGDAYYVSPEEWLTEEYGSAQYLAITDLRYPNEAQRVLDLGGEVWEVLRPGTASDGHDSEQVLSTELVTRQIDNSKDLLSLRSQVEKALGL